MTLAEKKLKLIQVITETADEAVLDELNGVLDKRPAGTPPNHPLPPLTDYTTVIGEKTDVEAIAQVQHYEPLALKGFVGFWELEDNEDEPLEDLLADLTP